MAEEPLTTVCLSGKPASLDSIRLSLARHELVALQATFATCAMPWPQSWPWTVRRTPSRSWTFLATHPFQERLDHAQDLLGAVVPDPEAMGVEA